MNLNNENNIIIEGMTSISALINAVSVGINDRKIINVYVTNASLKKKTREIGFLRHKSTELNFHIINVSDAKMEEITSGKTHGGIAALCSDRKFKQITSDNIVTNGFYVLIEGIEDPYNFGYTVRSLYAAGADGIILPERNWMSAAGTVIKASAGTTELIDIFAGDTIEAVKLFKNNDYKIICAGIRDSVSLHNADLQKPILLVIGGEKRGISRGLLDLADCTVRIDYGRSFMGSLTTASSAAIIAFEILKQNS